MVIPEVIPAATDTHATATDIESHVATARECLETAESIAVQQIVSSPH
jgi:hypothetical protein